VTTKRPRLQRLDYPFLSSRKAFTFDPAGRFELLSDVPLFANDGWFLLIDGTATRSWYQIQGKAYVPTPKHGRDAEQEQQSLIRHFKWVLQRRNDEETDVGTEVVQHLTRMWRRMPRSKQLPKVVADFIDTQKQLQHGKEMGHDMRRHRLRRRKAQQ
jgi:hypothetical protein